MPQIDRSSTVEFKGGTLSIDISVIDPLDASYQSSSDIADMVLAELVTRSATDLIPNIKVYIDLIGEDEPDNMPVFMRSECEVLGRTLKVSADVVTLHQGLDKNLMVAAMAADLVQPAFQVFTKHVTNESFRAAADVSGLMEAYQASSPFATLILNPESFGRS